MDIGLYWLANIDRLDLNEKVTGASPSAKVLSERRRGLRSNGKLGITRRILTSAIINPVIPRNTLDLFIIG